MMAKWRRGMRLLVVLSCIVGLGLVLSPSQPITVSDGQQQEQKQVHYKKHFPWQHFHPNRTLALVHIGKAGGLTLRAMTSLKCRLPRKQATKESIRECLVETFGTTDPQEHPLALQTIFYSHMNSMPPKELRAATSWLLALRNPVDRVISAYQYSHPANCQDTQQLWPNSTKGCINYFLLQKDKGPRTQLQNEQQLIHLFVTCFPKSDMELFVQAATTSTGGTGQDNCARLARDYISGRGEIFPIPHLRFNYQHYQTKVLDVYNNNTDKEWFGIRTEHLAQDYESLNQQLGGRASSPGEQQGQPVVKLTHGSEHFRSASKLSKTNYEKLCCFLQDELFIYRDLVQRLWNFDAAEKFGTIYSLAEKCGMMVGQPTPNHNPSNINEKGLELAWNIWQNTTCASIVKR